MKIYRLKIKSGSVQEPSGAMISSYRSSPSAEKVEHFRTEAGRRVRREQIEKAVDTIGLAAWLVSLENDEIEVSDEE